MVLMMVEKMDERMVDWKVARLNENLVAMMDDSRVELIAAL